MLEWVDVLLVGLLTSPREAGIYAVVTRCARASEVIHQAVRIAVGPQIAAAMATRARRQARGDLQPDDGGDDLAGLAVLPRPDRVR
ncbi:hypothetical protein [Aeromicrobium sp. UC242_57]|uniref:hypothetical protein n=1 Tax=Aeromicrobium sp. UC242_57 TaxID=3374624 RepID=UPI00378FFBCF